MNYLDVAFQCSSDVNFCPVNVSGTYYYLYGTATISCDEYVEPTQQPTEPPFCSPNVVYTEDLQFSIKLDDWPQETEWVIYDVDDSTDVIYQGNGTDFSKYAEIFKEACLQPNHCYQFNLTDDYGDGLSRDGDYGWFEFSVNSQFVTLGKQGLKRSLATVYFCTDLFEGADASNVQEFTFVTYDEGKPMTILVYDDDNDQTKYRNDYFIHSYLNSNASSSTSADRRTRRMQDDDAQEVDTDMEMTLETNTNYRVTASAYFELVIDDDVTITSSESDGDEDEYYVKIVVVEGGKIEELPTTTC